MPNFTEVKWFLWCGQIPLRHSPPGVSTTLVVATACKIIMNSYWHKQVSNAWSPVVVSLLYSWYKAVVLCWCSRDSPLLTKTIITEPRSSSILILIVFIALIFHDVSSAQFLKTSHRIVSYKVFFFWFWTVCFLISQLIAFRWNWIWWFLGEICFYFCFQFGLQFSIILVCLVVSAPRQIHVEVY